MASRSDSLALNENPTKVIRPEVTPITSAMLPWGEGNSAPPSLKRLFFDGRSDFLLFDGLEVSGGVASRGHWERGHGSVGGHGGVEIVAQT